MDVLLACVPVSPTDSLAAESAYCLELCTLKALNFLSLPLDAWEFPQILRVAL